MKTICGVICATLLVASFCACKKKTDVTAQLSVNRTAISLGTFEGFTDSFEVQSNIGWELQVSPASAAQWMAVSTSHGNAGKTIVKVSTTAVNTATQTATISVKPAGRETPFVEVAVTQKIYVVDWKKLVGSEMMDNVKSIARTPDGGFVIAGATLSDGTGDFPASSGYYDAYAMKLNTSGAIEWRKTYGGAAGDFFNSIAVTPDGGFIACGMTDSNLSGDIPPTKGSFDVWVVKLDATGEVVWSKNYGGTLPDRGHSVAITPNGEYVIAGETSSSNTGDVGAGNGSVDLWVFKLNLTGTIIWKKSYGGTAYDRALSVLSTQDGKIIVAGVSESANSGNVGESHGEAEGWVLGLDANGEIIWNKLFGGSDTDELHSIAATPDNGFVLSGYTYSDNSGDIGENRGLSDAWILKIDAAGNKIWSRTYGGSNIEDASAIAATPDGDLLMTGFTASNNNTDAEPVKGSSDLWLLKVNSMGHGIWKKTMGGSDGENGVAISMYGNGDFVVAGYTSSNNNGDVGVNQGLQDIWLLKFK